MTKKFLMLGLTALALVACNGTSDQSGDANKPAASLSADAIGWNKIYLFGVDRRAIKVYIDESSHFWTQGDLCSGEGGEYVMESAVWEAFAPTMNTAVAHHKSQETCVAVPGTAHIDSDAKIVYYDDAGKEQPLYTMKAEWVGDVWTTAGCSTIEDVALAQKLLGQLNEIAEAAAQISCHPQ